METEDKRQTEVTQPEQDNTSVDQGATAPAEAVEEEMTATAQEEEAPKLSVEEFCDAMETSAIFEHGEEAPFENAGKRKGQRKRTRVTKAKLNVAWPNDTKLVSGTRTDMRRGRY